MNIQSIKTMPQETDIDFDYLSPFCLNSSQNTPEVAAFTVSRKSRQLQLKVKSSINSQEFVTSEWCGLRFENRTDTI